MFVVLQINAQSTDQRNRMLRIIIITRILIISVGHWDAYRPGTGLCSMPVVVVVLFNSARIKGIGLLLMKNLVNSIIHVFTKDILIPLDQHKMGMIYS